MNDRMLNLPRRIIKERLSLLKQLEDWLELPMVVLGMVWLALLILDFVTEWGERLDGISTAIWIIFILDFFLKVSIAPNKARYLRSNWFSIIALALPALRVFRIFRAVRALRAIRAARGIRLVRVLTSLNRGMKALGIVFGRRGFGYAMGLSLIVVFAGSAGMYAFEREYGLSDYGTALWWTAMIVTTMGSDYWPKSPEGRILCMILAVYAFAVFGYVTATLASFFVEQDAKTSGTVQPTANQIQKLLDEMAALREEVRQLATTKSSP
ncbi:MAG: potassium channel family protein [Verrucomicrobiales bacterium]